jgi:hypothetical protein
MTVTALPVARGWIVDMVNPGTGQSLELVVRASTAKTAQVAAFIQMEDARYDLTGWFASVRR